MVEVKKPVPEIDDESRPFFEAAKEGRLSIQKCSSCGTFRFPPRLRCPSCLSTDTQWTDVSGRGNVFTFGIWHQVFHPAFADEAPYNVAVVELEEGPHMVTSIVDCPNDSLRIGMPVQVVYTEPVDGVVLAKFKPVQ